MTELTKEEFKQARDLTKRIRYMTFQRAKGIVLNSDAKQNKLGGEYNKDEM